MPDFVLGKNQFTCANFVELTRNPISKLKVDDSSWDKLTQFRNHVDKVVKGDQTVYGINTGFGFLSDVRIEREKLKQLQYNLIRSHAAGVGKPIKDRFVRAMMVLKLNCFLMGNSGASLGCAKTLHSYIENDLLPVVPRQGSVGASGDLAPLSHIALGLIGEGRVTLKGLPRDTKDALARANVEPHILEAKDGLALINGTQFMTALAAYVVNDAKVLADSCDVITAMSLEAFRGTKVAFDPRIHELRGQEGQKKSAINILKILDGKDEIMDSHADCGEVQDPYSFRCSPQVQGASRDVFDYCETIIERELNSNTDNPLVFKNGDIVSGGNFHGQPVAFAMDFVAIAAAELGSISERRIEKLTNPSMSKLPAFVTKDGGLNSGFMIPHVAAASLVSENKVLCHPASIDSIPTSADKEDHVSMGPICARKAEKVLRHVSKILSIELLASAQGVEFHKPLKPSPALEIVFDEVRKLSPAVEVDRSLHEDIEVVAQWIKSGEMIRKLRQEGIALSQ